MNYPKIGIRPIIDGRLGGERESLDATTMQMDRNVAALFAKELCYPDGKPVAFLIPLVCLHLLYGYAFYGSRLHAKVCYSNSAPEKKFHNIH